jgi:hypothetical protein
VKFYSALLSLALLGAPSGFALEEELSAEIRNTKSKEREKLVSDAVAAIDAEKLMKQFDLAVLQVNTACAQRLNVTTRPDEKLLVRDLLGTMRQVAQERAEAAVKIPSAASLQAEAEKHVPAFKVGDEISFTYNFARRVPVKGKVTSLNEMSLKIGFNNYLIDDIQEEPIKNGLSPTKVAAARKKFIDGKINAATAAQEEWKRSHAQAICDELVSKNEAAGFILTAKGWKSLPELIQELAKPRQEALIAAKHKAEQDQKIEAEKAAAEKERQRLKKLEEEAAAKAAADAKAKEAAARKAAEDAEKAKEVNVDEEIAKQQKAEAEKKALDDAAAKKKAEQLAKRKKNEQELAAKEAEAGIDPMMLVLVGVIILGAIGAIVFVLFKDKILAKIRKPEKRSSLTSLTGAGEATTAAPPAAQEGAPELSKTMAEQAEATRGQTDDGIQIVRPALPVAPAAAPAGERKKIAFSFSKEGEAPAPSSAFVPPEKLNDPATPAPPPSTPVGLKAPAGLTPPGAGLKAPPGLTPPGAGLTPPGAGPGLKAPGLTPPGAPAQAVPPPLSGLKPPGNVLPPNPALKSPSALPPPPPSALSGAMQSTQTVKKEEEAGGKDMILNPELKPGGNAKLRLRQ